MLGTGMMYLHVAVNGSFTHDSALRLAEVIVHGLGLHGAPGHVVRDYPLPDGRGGVGFTLWYPLTESYFVIDAYPDLLGGYIELASCVPFDKERAFRLIELAGFVIVEKVLTSLCLVHEPPNA